MTTTIKELSEMKGYELREAGDHIKAQYRAGQLTYDTATEALNVILAEANKRGAEIAKKHGKRHYPVSAKSELR
jgi:hypothetical protein